MSQARKKAAPRWRRLLGALAAVLLLFALLPVAAYLYLSSSAGERWARGIVVEEAQAAIAGRLGVGGVELSGRRVVLTDVVLDDPEGTRVAEIERVELWLATAALLRGELALDSAAVTRPRLFLVHDERGLNLTRALASRTPSTGPSSPAPDLRVGRLSLEGGLLDVTLVAGDERTRYVLDHLAISGGGGYRGKSERLAAHAAVRGEATHPVRLPLGLDVEARGVLSALEAKVSASLGEARLQASSAVAGDRLTLVLDELVFPPRVGRALVPRWPLAAPLSLRGRVSREGAQLVGDVEGRAGKSTLTLRGDFDTTTWKSKKLTLGLRDLNLSELFTDAPASQLRLDATLEGGGRTLDSADGLFVVDVPRSTIAGQQVGPLRLRAQAKGGQVELSELVALVPGVRLGGQGKVRTNSLGLSATLEVSDLGALRRTVGSLGQTLPVMAGQGDLALSVTGPLLHPRVSVRGAFGLLTVDAVSLTRLELDATVPDATRPLESQGKLSVGTLRLGERSFKDVSAQLTTEGRELSAQLTARGLSNLAFFAQGTLQPGGEGLLLRELRAAYPEAEWKSVAPALVRWAGERFALAPLELASAAGAVQVEGELHGKRLSARLDVRQLDLEKLPSVLAPASLGLAGRLSFTLAAAGTTRRPTADLSLQLDHGRLFDLRALQVRADVAYRKERAAGKLALASAAGRLNATFDLPPLELLEPPRRSPGPVKLELAVAQLSLGEALRASRLLRGRPLSEVPAAQVTGSVLVEGTSADLRLSKLELDAREVRWRRVLNGPEPVEVSLARVLLGAQSHEAKRLSAKLELDGFGGSGSLAVSAPVTLRELLDLREKAADRLAEAYLRADVELRSLELSALGALAGLSSPPSGRLNLEGHLEGPPGAPRGQATLRIETLTVLGVPPSDAEATLRADAESTELRASLRRGPAVLLAVEHARVAAPIEQLPRATRLASARVALRARVGPMPVAELAGFVAALSDEPFELPHLGGQLRLLATGSGTLERPTLELGGEVDQLSVGRVVAGKLKLAASQLGDGLTAHAELRSPSGGELTLGGRLGTSLGWKSLDAPIDWKAVPLYARVEAKGVGLEPFSGVHPRVRLLGGTLDGAGSARGTLAAPELSGKLDWKSGRLALLGLGEYRDIELSVEGSRQKVRVAKLFARGGSGTLQLEGLASKADASWTLDARGKLARFPVIMDDQLLAILSTDVAARGVLTASELFLSELSLPETLVLLPDVRRKDLQELDRPPDVVVIRPGQKRARAPRSPTPSSPGPAESGGMRYRVVVAAPRVLVKSSDVDLELKVAEGFEVIYTDHTETSGQVSIVNRLPRRSSAELLGRKVTFDSGRFFFNGAPTQPHVDVVASHVNEREGVTVKIAITGVGKNLSFSVSSTPPLPESDIYLLLATGRRELKRNTGSAMSGAQAASILGAVLINELKTTMSKKLPIDVFSLVDVLAVDVGDQGLAETSVRAGKYLSDRLYLGYEGKMGADRSKGESGHAGKIELQLNRNLSLEGSAGDAPSAGADLIWSWEY